MVVTRRKCGEKSVDSPAALSRRFIMGHYSMAVIALAVSRPVCLRRYGNRTPLQADRRARKLPEGSQRALDPPRNPLYKLSLRPFCRSRYKVDVIIPWSLDLRRTAALFAMIGSRHTHILIVTKL